MSTKPKILVILGPTASGKSSLAVKLAKKMDGEIISADSRQVYKGMDIGTAKVTKKEMAGVRHHLLDVASPKKQFSVAQFQKLGRKALSDILERRKLPIICGGTAHYIDALLGEQSIPDVPPDQKLRAELEKLSIGDLYERLHELDPARAGKIDWRNPRRLIRALEIVMKTGQPVPPQDQNIYSNVLKNIGIEKGQILKIGLAVPEKELKRRLHARLLQWLKRGLINEVKKLKRSGVSSKRLADLGMIYGSADKYIAGKISKEEMLSEIELDMWHYVKRQMTWWKRDPEIRWVRNEREASRLIK